MLKITIPKPCDEDWEAMIPNQLGRHCTACAKTVVDFTVMTDEEVQQYFIQQKEERVCGRFKQEQLHRIVITLPINILQITMPRWKQFLTACLLAFSGMLFSCDSITQGEPLLDVIEIIIPKDRIFNDSITHPYPLPEPQTEITLGLITPTIVPTVTTGDIELEVDNPLILSEDIIASPVNELDSSKYFVGKIALDSNIISPILPVNSAQIKNPPKADSTNCNNMKYY